jgi:hypothetical protein
MFSIVAAVVGLARAFERKKKKGNERQLFFSSAPAARSRGDPNDVKKRTNERSRRGSRLW